MKIMKLSVVIPCFNAEKTIEEQLLALSQQKWNDDWEIVIVDNGSTDNTIKIVESYQHHFLNLRIIDASKKKGASYARNAGVLAAQGDLIVFCDADDKVEEGWLTAMASALEKHDLVAGKLSLKLLNESWRVPENSPFETEIHPQKDIFTYRHIPNFKYAPASNLGIHKDIHMSIGGFDENIIYNQDQEYCIRAQKFGFQLYFAPDAVIEYRLRHNIWKTYLQFYRWGKYSILVFRKHVGPGNTIERLKFIFGGWRHLFGKIIRIRSKAHWYELFEWLGGRIGEAEGCLIFLIFSNPDNSTDLKDDGIFFNSNI